MLVNRRLQSANFKQVLHACERARVIAMRQGRDDSRARAPRPSTSVVGALPLVPKVVLGG
jgi:hypothetical protein